MIVVQAAQKLSGHHQWHKVLSRQRLGMGQSIRCSPGAA